MPRSWLLGCVCLWLAGGWLAVAEDNAGVSEYQVKAVFLYNFTKFTDWPASAFASSNAPIVIGIVGEDPFGKTLDAVINGDTARGHPLVVKRLRADEDLRSCQVLFIGRSEKKRLSSLLQKLKSSPVLTVSDATDFAEQGGMVSFLLVQKNVKFEINQAAAEAAGLQISAKLLKLAYTAKSN
jgi:hypothetical protein